MKLDMHVHTTRHSPDGQIDPFALAGRARELGLDGVVITEHDWLWTEAELQQLRAADPGLLFLAGVEVSCREGHFLAYGIHNPFAVPRGMKVANLCREVHRQGGVVVGAHPFRWGQDFDRIMATEHPELDGLELMSNNMDADGRRRAAAVQQTARLAGLGNSDAHTLDVLGVCYTEFEDTITNMAELVGAIQARRTTAHERRV
jgi:predicted metal-dependent phosphoesterase TrpH